MPVRLTTTIPESSFVTTLPMGLSVGGSFTGLTVSAKESLAVPPSASRTVTVMIATPNCLRAGSTVTVRLDPLPPKLMLFVGTSTGFEEDALSVRLPSTVSTSPTVKAMGPVEVSSLTDRFGMSLIVGRSFTERNVRTNILLTALVPSLTVIVMVAVPN